LDNELCIVAILKSRDGRNARKKATLGIDMFLRLSEVVEEERG